MTGGEAYNVGMKKIVAEVCGWYGAIALLLAFGLVSFSIVTANQLSYQLLNITGAIGIVIVSMTRKAYPPCSFKCSVGRDRSRCDFQYNFLIL